jgi:hypothetical protein
MRKAEREYDEHCWALHGPPVGPHIAREICDALLRDDTKGAVSVGREFLKRYPNMTQWESHAIVAMVKERFFKFR